jgi:hypothetical protein
MLNEIILKLLVLGRIGEAAAAREPAPTTVSDLEEICHRDGWQIKRKGGRRDEK